MSSPMIKKVDKSVPNNQILNVMFEDKFEKSDTSTKEFNEDLRGLFSKMKKQKLTIDRSDTKSQISKKDVMKRFQKSVFKIKTINAMSNKTLPKVFDFSTVNLNFVQARKHYTHQFLQSLNRFKKWQFEQVTELNRAMEFKIFEQGEVIYDIGSPTDNFYLVLQGKLYMEAKIKLTNRTRYPIGTQKWEIKTVTRTLSYRVNELNVGSMFGHEEILQETNRICKVTAQTKWYMLVLPSNKFWYFFSKELIQDKENKEKYDNLKYSLIKRPRKTFNFLDKIDFREITEQVRETDMVLRKKSDAILKGFNVNPLQVHGREIHTEDRLLNKLKYVIQNAKKKVCPGSKEIIELDKTIVVDETERISHE